MLKSVSLHNFKCLREINNVNLAKINLLTGVNGEGKSTFVQALLVLSQTWNKGKYDLLNPSDSEMISLGGFQQILSYDAAPREILVGLSFDGESGGSFEMRYDESVQNSQYGELCGLKFNGEEMLADATDMDSADDMDVETISTTPILGTLDSYPTLMSLKRMFYVSASRRAAYRLLRKNLFEKGMRLLPDGFNVLQMMAAMEPEEKDILRQYMTRIFDGATINIEEDDENFRLQLDSQPESTHLYDPINVGYGYSYVLTMLVSLIVARENDYIVIENPEAHLHPSAQAEVIKIIAEVATSKNVQLFIETHSDHIVNGALVAVNRGTLTNRDLEILFFNKGQVQNLEITGTGRIMNPPQKFCDQYTKDLDVLFGDVTTIFE